MPDREKVMTWLEICGENRDCSATCPYGDGSGEDEDSRCREKLMEDALALLKEQEAMKPISKSRHGANPQIQHFCRRCNAMLFHHKQKYCIMCGQAVKWNG